MVKGGGPVRSSSSKPRPWNPLFQKNTRSKAQPGDKVQVVCDNCGEAGHTSPVCPKRKHKATSLCYVPRPELIVPPEEQSDFPLTSVQLNGKRLTALLDTGCSQSLVQPQLVPSELCSKGETVPVICVHGHEEHAPTAEVYIEAKGRVYRMKVGVAPELPYPILLGTDLPVLYELIQESRERFCGTATLSKAKQSAIASVPDAFLSVGSAKQQAEQPITSEAVPAPLSRTPDSQTHTLQLMLFHWEKLVPGPRVTQKVLTDQVPNFMICTLSQTYQLLGSKRVRTTPYHPQTDGLVGFFIQTPGKFVSVTGEESGWDKWPPFLLFSYHEVPHALTGFSPFELLYAHQMRGLLDGPYEAWEGPGKSQDMSIISYVLKMWEQLLQTQVKQKEWYDWSARQLSFEPGEEVRLPTSQCKLLAKW